MTTALFKHAAMSQHSMISIDYATVVNALQHKDVLDEHQYHLSLIVNTNVSYPQHFDATIVFDDIELEEFYLNEVTTSDRVSFKGYRDDDNIVHIIEMTKI